MSLFINRSWHALVLLSVFIWLPNEKSYGQFPALDGEGKIINDKNWRINSACSDEFNYSPNQNEIKPIDPSKWDVDINDHGGDAQLYRNNLENIWVQNGYLNIQMLLNTPDENHLFSSGSCHTLPAYNFNYGFIEISCKWPGGKGFWPAFWLMDCVHNLPFWIRYREIDICEMYGVDGYNMLYTSTIYDDKNDNDTICEAGWLAHREILEPNSFVEAEHKYSLEWDPQYLIFYFDNLEIWRRTNHPHNYPLGLILNLAFDRCLCPNCHGNIETLSNEIPSMQPCLPKCLPDCYDVHQFDKKMSVNYVRTFQKIMDCQTDDHFFNPKIFRWGVKKSIYVDPGVTITVNTTLRATDWIEIGCSFTVPLGTEFCAITNDICY
ncbi:MAG: glycoside hydrolase family 16 protein [Bacteroidales bacterium]|jgi:hypothetical protein|nr:glycoside hydrolase family 16 protein [Bacteroidales bacterium]